MSDDLLHHPEVVAVIRAVLRSRGFPAGLLEDGIQTVMLRALQALKGVLDRPDTIERWQAFVRPIANALGVDEVRHGIASREVIVGPTGEADQAPSPTRNDSEHPLDVRKKLETVDEMHKEGKIHAAAPEIIEGLAAGKNAPQIASEMGKSPQWVRTVLMKTRQRVNAQFVLTGLTATFVVLLVVYGVSLRVFHPDIAHNPKLPVGAPDAGAAPHPETPPPEVMVDVEERTKKAAALLQEAEEARRNEEWRHCIRAAHEAQDLDAGDTARMSEVVEACEKGTQRQLNSKGARHDAGARLRK